MCSHKGKIQNISDGIFILSPGSCPRGETLGRWGAKGVNLISNMVIWHIKSTGMLRGGGGNANKIFILGSNW